MALALIRVAFEERRLAERNSILPEPRDFLGLYVGEAHEPRLRVVPWGCRDRTALLLAWVGLDECRVPLLEQLPQVLGLLPRGALDERVLVLRGQWDADEPPLVRLRLAAQDRRHLGWHRNPIHPVFHPVSLVPRRLPFDPTALRVAPVHREVPGMPIPNGVKGVSRLRVEKVRCDAVVLPQVVEIQALVDRADLVGTRVGVADEHPVGRVGSHPTDGAGDEP